MFFIKSGTLCEAMRLARDEQMLDGQDPLVVMNGCSDARMSAPVMVEIEVSGGKHAPHVEEVSRGTTLFAPEEQGWPVLLKMYVTVQSPPFRQANAQKDWYMFARRIRPEHNISGFLARLSERRLNFKMNVR